MSPVVDYPNKISNTPKIANPYPVLIEGGKYSDDLYWNGIVHELIHLSKLPEMIEDTVSKDPLKAHFNLPPRAV